MSQRRFSQSSASPFAERKTGISIMTKAALLSSAALAVFLVVPAASAADLPFRKSPPASAPEPIFNGPGSYVGVNQGFGGAALMQRQLGGPCEQHGDHQSREWLLRRRRGRLRLSILKQCRLGCRDGYAMERG